MKTATLTKKITGTTTLTSDLLDFNSLVSNTIAPYLYGSNLLCDVGFKIESDIQGTDIMFEVTYDENETIFEAVISVVFGYTEYFFSMDEFLVGEIDDPSNAEDSFRQKLREITLAIAMKGAKSW